MSFRKNTGRFFTAILFTIVFLIVVLISMVIDFVALIPLFILSIITDINLTFLFIRSMRATLDNSVDSGNAIDRLLNWVIYGK